jgi:hypothetical protein
MFHFDILAEFASEKFHAQNTGDDKVQSRERERSASWDWQWILLATEHHVHTHRETDRGETKHISMMNVTSQCFLDTR